MIYAFEVSAQAASTGTWSLNTHYLDGIIGHIFIAAVNTTTSFDLQLIDEKSNIVYDTVRREKSAYGILDDEIYLPARGIYTIKVYDAHSDDRFSGRLMLTE